MRAVHEHGFKEFLHGRRMKVTQERLELFNTAANLPGEFDGNDLLKKMSKSGFPVAHSTFYRNLRLLIAAGAIEPVGRRRGRPLFKGRGSCTKKCNMQLRAGEQLINVSDPDLLLAFRRICQEVGLDCADTKITLEFGA
ncbi:MAG: hypothetical protein GY750_18440 [Lentisphaerae bacterium]|nr:hypothetical protein [Lentisphaerota bacterium]MCP4103377.1 hypothetical protein [Lentisphaerota bacterium]